MSSIPANSTSRRPMATMRPEEIEIELDTELTRPDAVLESLVGRLAKGQSQPDGWERLHRAAERDSKLADLAFAYEQVTQDRRVRLLPAETQGEVLCRAADFYAEVFGDLDTAIGLAERALAAAPRRSGAIERLERWLGASERRARLAKACVVVARAEDDPERRDELLDRAATLAINEPSDPQAAVEALEQILHLRPDLSMASVALEQQLLLAGRWRDAARRMEARLAGEPGSVDEQRELRERLLVLYVTELREPQKALILVEALLEADPSHEKALQAAERLCSHPRIAPRALALLSDAQQHLGNREREAALLTQELKTARGPRRIEVQRRLAILRQDLMGDPAGALDLLGPVMSNDPSDDATRARFVHLSMSLDRPVEAVRLLGRALQMAKEPALRAKLNVDLAMVLLRTGEMRRARSAFEEALRIGADETSSLRAARILAGIYGDASDLPALGAVLEAIVRLEQDVAARHAAARRLADLAEGELDDAVRAVLAWRALEDSQWADEALTRLAAHYERSNEPDELVRVLRARAATSADPARRLELDIRATELRTHELSDDAAKIEAWQGVIERHGAVPEAVDRLIPLLETQERILELAQLLEMRLAQAQDPESARYWARLGRLRSLNLDDPEGALECHKTALKFDPNEQTSRNELLRCLGDDRTRAQAASILEPVLRSDGPSPELLELLKAKAGTVSDPSGKFDILTEAYTLAEGPLGQPEAAFAIAASAAAAASETEFAEQWLARCRATENRSEPGERAHALLEALGDRDLDDAGLRALASLAADALAEAGDADSAATLLRRALTYEPNSPELLSRVDELLAAQSSPEDRLSLYQQALEHESDVQRQRDLWVKMAILYQRELAQTTDAIAAWRTVISLDEKHWVAHQALVALLDDGEQDNELADELARALQWLTGERRLRTLDRLVQVEARQGRVEQALSHALEALSATGADDHRLAVAQRLAEQSGNLEALEGLLAEQLKHCTSPQQTVGVLAALGNARIAAGRGEAAAEALMEASRQAEKQGDRDKSLELLERATEQLPADTALVTRLLELCSKADDLTRMGPSLQRFFEAGGDERDIVQRLMDLGSKEAGAVRPKGFADLAQVALSKIDDPLRRRLLGLARARSLGTRRDRLEAAASAYRGLIEQFGAADAEIVADFVQLLLGVEDSPEWRAEWRWLFEQRAAVAAEPAIVLSDWARVEEERYGDAEAASSLYERIVASEPDRLDAWAELARLRRAAGDAEGTQRALGALARLSDDESRLSLLVERARLLCDPLARPAEALDVVEPLVRLQPGDPALLAIVRAALDDASTRGRAAELLEQVAVAVADVAARSEVLETLLNVTAGAAGFDSERARWTLLLLDSKVDDPEASLETALRLAEQLVGQWNLWDRAERAARQLSRPAPVMQAYERALEASRDPAVAEQIGRQLVDFHEEWAEDPERVVVLLEHILSVCPSANWAFDRLKLAFNAAGRFDDLFAAYDRMLEHADDPGARVETLREAAMAAKDFADHPDRAIHYFVQLDELTPGDSRVEAALERLYDRQGQWRPLIDLLTRQMANASGDVQHQLRARVANLWLKIDEPLSAFALVEKMAEARPDAPEVIELLEQLVALAASRESLVPASKHKEDRKRKSRPATVRDRAAVMLRQHYESVGQTEHVVRMLEIEVEYALDAKDRIERIRRIVAVRLEELDDAVGAFDNVVTLVTLDPASVEFRELLDTLAERTDQRLRQANLLVDVADERAGTALGVALRLEAARVCQVHLRDEPRAIDLYAEVLGTAGKDRALALTAARELDGLLGTALRHAERCDVLERLSDLETEAEARRTALGEAAHVALNELDDAARAVRAWQHRLGDDADDSTARDGLVVALEHTGQTIELIAALEERAERSADPQAARADRSRVARLYEAPLGQIDAAIEAWRRLRELHGCDDESFRALLELFSSTERWSDQADLLAGEADRELDAQRRQALLGSLARLYVERLADPRRAVGAFVSADDWEKASEVVREARADRASSRVVCRDLLDLAVTRWRAEGNDPACSAARTAAWTVAELGSRLREAGDYPALVELLMEGADLPFERAERRAFLREAAFICSDDLKDSRRAVEILERLFGEDPGDSLATSAVTRFAILLEEAGRHADVVALWEEQAQVRLASGDPAASAALWVRAASLAEERLEDIDRALRDYAEGAQLGLEAALEALARLYTVRGESLRAAEMLERLCAQSERELLGERSLRLAEAYITANRPELARERLEHASETALDVGPVRERLAELYVQAELWGKLAEIYALEAARSMEPSRRLDLLRRAAVVHLERRGAPEAAVPLIESALELDPEGAELRLQLADALVRASRPGDAVRVLGEQIERYGARRPKERAAVHHALASALLHLQDRAGALEELRAANRIDPADPVVMSQLARLSLELEELDQAESTYRALLLVLGRHPEGEYLKRTEALIDLSDIALRRGDAQRASEAVESAFEEALESPEEALALEEALRAKGRYELLVRAIEARLLRAEQPGDAARALANLALLHARSLGDLPDVTESLRQRADLIQTSLEKTALGDDGAWTSLGQVYDCLGDEAAEARILERRVKAWLDGKVRIDDPTPLVRLAETRLANSEQRDEGLALLQRAAEVGADFERLESALRRSLEADPDWTEALDLLERVARASRRDDYLAQVLSRRLCSLGATPSDYAEALRLAREARDDSTVEWLLDAATSGRLAVGLSDSERTEAELELATRLAARGDIARALDLREHASDFVSTDQRRTLLLDVARLAADVLEDRARAARLYGRLHDESPGDPSLWKPLLEHLRAIEDVAAQRRVITATIPEASPEDRLALRLEQSRLFLDIGEVGAAADQLHELLEEEPQQADAALLLADILERTGRREELLALLETQLTGARERGEEGAIAELALRIAGLYESQEPKDAIEHLDLVLALQPDRLDALESLVRLCERTGDLERAADGLERMIQRTPGPDVRDLLDRVILLREQLEDQAGIDAALLRGFEVFPADAALAERLVKRSLARGDHAGAAEVLSRAADARPEDIALRLQLVTVCRAAGQLERALQVIESLVADGSGGVDLQRERGRLLVALGRYEEGLAELQASVDDSPEGIEALLEGVQVAEQVAEGEAALVLGLREVTLLEQLDRMQLAVERLSTLDRNYPDDHRILAARAHLARISGDRAFALDTYERLAQVLQDDALHSVALELADIAQDLEAPERARAGLERALASDPEAEDIRGKLAGIYRAVGEHRELAQLLLQDARRSEDPAERQSQLLEIAELLMGDQGDLQQAESVLEEARTLGPENLDVTVLLARLLARSERGEQAMALLEEVISAHRGRRSKALAGIYKEMSTIQLQDGFLTDALESLVKASEMDIRNGAIAAQLGRLALEIDEVEIAHRAFGRVALMKLRHGNSAEGALATDRADANYYLALSAFRHGDTRKTKVLIARSLTDNPEHTGALELSEKVS